jgi:alanine dehydrogenase
MRIGILDEQRRRDGHERRTPLTPQGVAILVQAGNAVRVEQGTGRGASFSEQDWLAAGAEVVHRAVEVLAASELIVTLGWLDAEEIRHVTPGSVTVSLHRLEMAPAEIRKAFRAAGVVSLSADRLTDERGEVAVLARLGELAGALVPQVASRLLESTEPGRRGVILSRLPGVAPAEAVILGAGRLGVNAALHLARAGAAVHLIDRDMDRLSDVARWLPDSVVTLASAPPVIERAVKFADVLIGAAGTIGSRAPVLVSEEQVASMRPGSVIIDLAIDHGGNVATSRPTHGPDDAYLRHGVVHLAMPNLTSLVARTASRILSQTLRPSLERIVAAGRPATDPALSAAIWSDQGDTP